MSVPLRRFFSDRQGRIVIAEPPNLPLVAWAALSLGAWVASGRAESVLEFLSGAALVTWSYLEIRHGASPFRRVLGGVVLMALILVRAFQH